MKIGVCFPALDFEKMNFTEFTNYTEDLRNSGLTSFDFFIDFFLELDDKKRQLLKYLEEKNMKITFHYCGLINDAHKKMETVLNNINVDYRIPIVFHLPNYDQNKYSHIKQIVTKILNLLEHKQFDVLIETLSKNHSVGQNLGDDISEINLFLKTIPHDNFGICWDLGHTRLNHIEEGSSLYLHDISRVKMTHIHNFYYKNKFVDHIPLSDMDYQDEEIIYLLKNGYKGIYSLEFPLNNLKENVLVYMDSVRKLKKLIEEVTNEL